MGLSKIENPSSSIASDSESGTPANDSESVMEVLKLKPAGYVLKSTSLKDIFDTIFNFFKKQNLYDEDDDWFE